MYLVTCITANPAEYFYWLDKKKMLIFFTVEHQHSSLRLNYTFLNTFPQNPVFSNWVSVFKRENSMKHIPPSSPLSLSPPLPPSLSPPAELQPARPSLCCHGRGGCRSGWCDGRSCRLHRDGGAGKMLFLSLFFFFRIISDAVFAETDRMEERPAPPGLSGLWHRCSSRDGEKLCSTAATLTSPAV